MRLFERQGKLPIIETRRLLLRDIEIEDITDEYLAWLNDPEVVRFLEIRFEPQTVERVRAYVQSKLDDVKTTNHFGVYNEGGRKLVGTVTLPKINRHHRHADLSFVIGHPDARGRGYATEAVHAVCYYAFHYLELHKLWAGYYAEHVVSAKILAKNGFKVEGCLQEQLLNVDGVRSDHVLVGLLGRDFVPDESLLGCLPSKP